MDLHKAAASSKIGIRTVQYIHYQLYSINYQINNSLLYEELAG